MTSASAGTVLNRAFQLYVFSLPFEVPQRGIPFEIHTLTGVIFLTAALWQPRVAFRAPPAAFWWYVAYFLVYVSLGVMTDHTDEWLRKSVLFVQLLLLFWATTNVMRDVAVARMAMITLAASCVVLAVMQRLGIATSVAEVGNLAERVTVLGQNPNTFAHNLALGLLAILGFAYATDVDRRLKAAYLLPCGVIGLAIMPTAARGALLTLMLGITMIMLTRGTARVRLRNIAVAVVLLAGLSMAAYRTDGMRNRLRVAAESNDLALREQLFPAAWQMFLEKPLLGWGPVNNRYELQTHVPRVELAYREAHNIVLELLTETGLIGALPYLVAMALSVLASWRARLGPHGIMPFAMVLTVLASRMATSGVYTKMDWFVLAFALASAPQRTASSQTARLLRRAPAVTRRLTAPVTAPANT